MSVTETLGWYLEETFSTLLGHRNTIKYSYLYPPFLALCIYYSYYSSLALAYLTFWYISYPTT